MSQDISSTHRLRRDRTVTKRVAELQVGDVLTGSGARVTVAPRPRAKLPSGVVELYVVYRPGQPEQRATWRRNTRVRVLA